MIRTLLIACFVFFCLGKVQLSAQCIDTTHIQYGAYCDPQWIPVCGCDGYTYRSDCFARNAGLNYWVYGICDPIDFDFNPNPATDYINVDAIMRVPGDMYVQLSDRFGKIFYSTTYQNPGELQFQIDIRGFNTGIYFLNIFCSDGYRVKKILLPDIR